MLCLFFLERRLCSSIARLLKRNAKVDQKWLQEIIPLECGIFFHHCWVLVDS